MLTLNHGRRHRGNHDPTHTHKEKKKKRKKGNKGKKERVSKQKLLKGCHQGQYIIVLAILEPLEFENFSCRPAMVADNTLKCSMNIPP